MYRRTYSAVAIHGAWLLPGITHCEYGRDQEGREGQSRDRSAQDARRKTRTRGMEAEQPRAGKMGGSQRRFTVRRPCIGKKAAGGKLARQDYLETPAFVESGQNYEHPTPLTVTFSHRQHAQRQHAQRERPQRVHLYSGMFTPWWLCVRAGTLKLAVLMACGCLLAPLSRATGQQSFCRCAPVTVPIWPSSAASFRPWSSTLQPTSMFSNWWSSHRTLTRSAYSLYAAVNSAIDMMLY